MIGSKNLTTEFVMQHLRFIKVFEVFVNNTNLTFLTFLYKISIAVL